MSGTEIDVCVCTFRRPSLALTLESLSRQTLGDGVRIRVIVADNDETPTARALAQDACRQLGLDLVYVHAPSRNISLARNACLDAAKAPLVAFIDDDEIATPDWLSLLLAERERTGAAAIFGPVRALYGPEAPNWMRRGDLHSFRATRLGDGSIRTGYTSNVLMDRAAVGQNRFDLALGQSGGEDTEFFHRLHMQGLLLGAADGAVVEEPVVPGRARLSWLLERSFRSGQTHARLLAAAGRRPAPSALLASVKCATCLALGLALAWRPDRAARQLQRAALHAGVVSKILGAEDVQIYASSKPKAVSRV